MKGANYINRIIDGDLKAFDEVYYKYKTQFIALFRRNYAEDSESALDLYHDTIAAFNNNIETHRIVKDSLDDCKIKAYLNNTGKYILFNRRRKKQAPLTFNTDFILNFNGTDANEEYDPDMDNKLFIVRSSVRDMPMPCSQLLILVCFKKKSHEEVARIMSYASADSVKTQRYRCMEKLKDVVKNRFKMCGYEQ